MTERMLEVVESAEVSTSAARLMAGAKNCFPAERTAAAPVDADGQFALQKSIDVVMKSASVPHHDYRQTEQTAYCSSADVNGQMTGEKVSP